MRTKTAKGKDRGFGSLLCTALNDLPDDLARRVGTEYEDLFRAILYVPEQDLPNDAHINPVYDALLSHVDKKLGELMAAREAILRKKNTDLRLARERTARTHSR